MENNPRICCRKPVLAVVLYICQVDSWLLAIDYACFSSDLSRIDVQNQINISRTIKLFHQQNDKIRTIND